MAVPSQERVEDVTAGAGPATQIARFGETIERLLGIAPALRLIPVGAREVQTSVRHGEAALVFELGEPGYLGELALPAGHVGADMLPDLVPLARTLLLAELACRRQRDAIERLSRDNATLRSRAELDPLTGLLNRAAFRDAVEARLSTSGPEGRGAFIIADLDAFKAINDTHGHAFGDTYLQHFADTLRAVTRQVDLSARIGGDEFALYVEALPATRGFPESLVARVSRSFDNRVAQQGERAMCRVSFGIAHVRRESSYPALFHEADTALYRAKRARGRAAG